MLDAIDILLAFTLYGAIDTLDGEFNLA